MKAVLKKKKSKKSNGSIHVTKIPTPDELMKAIEDLDDLKPVAYEPDDEDEFKVNIKPANPHKYASHSYKRTAHPVAQEVDAVVYIDEERCKVIVRAGFNADFLNLSRHLAGRLFVKKEGDEVVDGKKKIIDKWWEFDVGPENIKELLRILTLCYRKVSIPPLDLLWMWDLLEVEDMEQVYRMVVKRCPDDGTKGKVDKFFKKYIDLSKMIIRASRRIELGDET